MPILAADVVLPVGRMPADWHETPALEEWIAQGYTTAPVEATADQADGIATAYTYYRGWTARAATLLGSPDSVGLEGMSVTQSNGRYDRMMNEAAGFKAEWEGLVAAVVPAPVPEVTLRVSRSTAAPIRFVWW